MLTFLQGTTLIIDNGTDRYELLISSGTASQTFLESSSSVKTIHNPNVIERVSNTEKGVVNLSFKCQVATDSVLLDWFGFELSAGKHLINPNTNTLKGYDVYLNANGTIYKVAGCIGQNISFVLSRKEILQVSITAVAATLETVASIPLTGTLVPQGSFYNGTIVVPGYSNLASISCEITKNISWLAQKSIFDIGSIYTSKNAVFNSMAISGSITQNKVDDTNTYNTVNTPILIQYGNTFEINLASCNSTNRWDMGDIHQIVTDYKLQPAAGNSYIKF